jgi:hypothetical protein
MRHHVGKPRDSAAHAVEEAKRRAGEELGGTAAACDRKAMVDVCHRLRVGQRAQVPAQRDALVQLREVGVEQELAQLGLADEHDAQQLAGSGLEVEQQPDLLEQLHGQRLGFIEHDDTRPSRLGLRDQEGVQRVEIGLLLLGAG